MTEGYQPPTSRTSSPDQDTTTLPRVNVPPAGSAGQSSSAGATAAAGSGGGWSQPSRNSSAGPQPSGFGGGAPSNFGTAADADGAPTGGIGARLSAATATVPSGSATAAAGSAVRTPAAESDTRSGRPSGRAARNARQPRRARLTLSHVNVYSVFKLSCVLAIALFFVWLIMVGVLYGILDVSGVFGRINQAVHQISGDGKSDNVVTGSLVGGFAIIIGVIYIVLFIALSTIGAMVYNLCADLVGGAEVTLSERE